MGAGKVPAHWSSTGTNDRNRGAGWLDGVKVSDPFVLTIFFLSEQGCLGRGSSRARCPSHFDPGWSRMGMAR